MTKHVLLALVILLIGVGAVLARRNLVLGRGDRRGAFRLAAGLVVVGMASWILDAHHVADLGSELGLIARGAGLVVVISAVLWLFYLALEPYVRRIRPSTLVSWTRLLSGGFGDAVVGRDVLRGATWGAALSFFFGLISRLTAWLGLPAESPDIRFLVTVIGPRKAGSAVLDFLLHAVLLGLGALLLYLIVRFVLRRELPTVLAFVAILSVAFFSGEPLWFSIVAGVLVMGSYAVVLLRVGLLAACSGLFFANCLMGFPLTTDFGSWRAGPTLTVLPLLGVLAVLAFRTALGGSGLRRYLAGGAASSQPRMSDSA